MLEHEEITRNRVRRQDAYAHRIANGRRAAVVAVWLVGVVVPVYLLASGAAVVPSLVWMLIGAAVALGLTLAYRRAY